MKVKIKYIFFLIAFSNLSLSNEFDPQILQEMETQMGKDLETNPLAIQWSNAITDEEIVEKFNDLLADVGNPPLSRQWAYPDHPTWPLVNWSKVDKLERFIGDQAEIPNQFGVIANSNQEAAKISTVGWLIRTSGKDMKPWFESWIIDLAKSQKTNLKRIAFLSISNFAEDIRRDIGDSGQQPVVNWNAWLEAFNQSDELGKAIILLCIKDLASRSESYDTAKTLHEAVFSGTNDALKAVALYQGSNQLGETVKTAWQDIAENHSNPKLKSLAQQAIGLWSIE